jgi:hypothetical protein
LSQALHSLSALLVTVSNDSPSTSTNKYQQNSQPTTHD